MKNKDKTKEQLLKEIDLLKDKISELVKSESKCKQAERELQQSEEKFRTLFEQAGDYILVHKISEDRGLVIVDANQAACQFHGYTHEEFIGKAICDIDRGLNEKQQETNYNKVLSGETILFETAHLRKDGTVFPVEVSFKLLEMEEGAPLLISIERDITKRKQAEKVLRESEEKYRAIFESLQDVYYRTDIKGRITIISPSVRVQAGYDPEDLIGHQVTDFYLNPSDRAVFSTRLNKFGFINDYELQLKAKDGRVIEVSISSKIIYGEDGSPSGIEGIIRDITERKKAEGALRESDEMAHASLNATIDMVFMIDTEGILLNINKLAARRFDKTQDELIGTNIFEYFPPDIAKSRKEYADKVRYSGKNIRFQDERDGRISDINIYPTFNELGNVDRLVVFVRDITKRKQAEEQLHESEERFRNLMEQSPVAIQILTPDGRVVSVNAAYMKLWGLSEETLLQLYERYNLLQDKQIRKLGVMPLFEKAFAGEAVIFPPVEYDAMETMKSLDFTKPKGEKCWIQVRLYPVKNDNGKIMNVVLMIEDITERKQAEDALKSSEERLKILFESAPDAYYLSDLKGTFIDGNKAAEDLMGYKKEELIGKSFLKLKILSTKELLRASKLLVKNVQGKGSGPDEFVLNRKDGSKATVEIRTYPVQIKDKTVILGIARDITERKKAEYALKESEKLNKAVIDNSPFGISVRDKKGSLLLSNKAWQNLWGFSENEITNYKEPRKNLVFNEKDSYLGEHLNKIKEIYETGGEYYIQEIKLSHSKKNKAEWISQYFYSIMDDKGNVQRVVILTEDITERKKSEEKLRESEQKFRSLVEQSSIAIQILTPDGYLERVNPRWMSLFNIPQEALSEVINKYNMLQDEEIIKLGIMPLVEKAFAGEAIILPEKEYDTSVPIETFGIEKVEKIKCWIHTRMYPVKNKDGEIVNVVAVHEDISDRKQAEQELSNTKEKFQAIIQNLMEGFYNVAMDGTLLDYNAEFVKILGLNPNEDYKGHKTPNYWVDLGDRQIYIEEILSKGFIKKYLINAKKSNGDEIILQLNSRIIKNESGDPVRIEGTFIDITDLKQAEEELRKREAQQALVLKSLPMAFYIAQPFGDYGGTWVSEQIGEISGFTAEQFMNDIHLWASRLHPEDRDRVLDEFDKVLEKEAIDIEYRWQALDGKYIWLLDSGVLIRDKKGKPIEIIGTWLDITERKKAEEQIARDLKIKTTLLQEIYHRTRNNMQLIISMLKIQTRSLENRSLTEDDGIDFLHDSFNEVINKIKSMSLVHQKLYQAEDLSHINLKEYIKDLVRHLMISFRVKSENVKLKFELEDVLVLIDSAIPLGLILNEMISNVFKHAFPHTKQDELFIKLYKEEDETINIHLSDNGVGIPSDIALENTNTMGLQTVFSLTEHQLNGEVKYEIENGLKWHISYKDNLHKERV